ncbi:something about silencing protein 10 [Schistocerca gregaria]|uniref:something about silencing protein 10 n=1 Tax=Schistocerca gregaria TaxID=7010 RepID=UPI00211E9146|nr:something about silencing protein 10 [Schistocerca gregaria]
MSKKSKGKKLDADLDVELQEYEPSDSEDDYSEDEKLMLENVRKRPREFDDESEEEVLGVASDDDEDDDDDDDDEGDDMASDLDGERDDDLPDAKAWGRKRKNFYNADYVDDDYGGFQKEEEEEAARLEEEEARQIQKRLASQLRDEDFGLSAFVAKDEKGEEKAEAEEVIATDLTKLSKRQKLSLVQKESPEFFALTRDFSEKMAVLKDELEPVMALIKAQKIPDCPATKFVSTVYHLVLNYCSNVSFYLLLKALRTPVAAHPVVGRLAKYRKLLAQAEGVYREVVRPQLATVLAADWDTLAASARLPEKKQKKKALRLLSAPLTEDGASDESGTVREGTPTPEKGRKRKAEEPEGAEGVESAPAAAATGATPALRALAAGSSSSAGEDSASEEIADGESGKEGDRRAITYEMAKNKGLTPYRKKEMRNPRVRHRRKYEKARVRRKGQVREPRKEVKKYGGEVSGIKIGVTKSIKLKV